MFRAELLIFGKVKNDTSEEVKSACQSVAEIGSVRHQIRSKSFKAYRFQRSVRVDCSDRATEERGKLLVLLPQTDAHTWTEKAARNSGAVEHSHRTILDSRNAFQTE